MGLLVILIVGALNVAAQTDSGSLSPAEAEKIIGAFTRKEAEFRRALNLYSFKRDALIQSIGMGGQVIGEYHRVSQFTFDDQGNRYEKINYFPMSSMPEVTPEDIDDLGGVEPFALEPSKVDKYNFRYVGKEKIDELNLYIFDVQPKVMPDPKKIKDRLFSGRIWVEIRTFRLLRPKAKVYQRQRKISSLRSKPIANTSTAASGFLPIHMPMKNSYMRMVARYTCG